MRSLTRIILACTALVCSLSAKAQSDEQIWSEYMLNYPFAGAWNVELAGTYSHLVQSPRWNALDIGLTPEYALHPNVDVMGGFLVSNTFQNASLSTFEYRYTLGTRVHLTPNSRVLTRLLVRYENRNMKDLEAGTWTYSNRARLRAETIIPINRRTMYDGDKLWYGMLDAEVFYVMNNDVEERYANRFRFRAGLGYRLNYGLRFEFLYTLQQSRNALGGDFDTVDNIFRFRIKQFLHASKPAKAVGVGN